MSKSVDAVRASVAGLVAAGIAGGETEASVMAEAAALAATAAERAPGAAADWGAAFGSRTSGFEAAARAGQSFTRRPTPVLARLVARGGEQAATYAQALAELASAACALGEPSLQAMGTASVIAAVQQDAAPRSSAAPGSGIGHQPCYPTSGGEDRNAAPATAAHASDRNIIGVHSRLHSMLLPPSNAISNRTP